MNNSGDAAEQMMRITFDGIEHVIRIAGAGAKNIAALIMAAVKKDGNDDKLKLRGKERLANMLKSGKELKIFPIKYSDLEQFSKEAKKYGVVYCAIKDKNAKPDTIIDVMAKADDAAKISRIMEKMEFATVDRDSSVSKATEQKREAKTPDTPSRDFADELLNEIMDKDGKAIDDNPNKAAYEMANPTQARTEKENNPSVSRSKIQSESAEVSSIVKKPKSVKDYLQEKTAQNKKREEKKVERDQPRAKNTQPKANHHKQPPKNKNKRTKER